MNDTWAFITDHIQKTSQAAAYALGDLLEPLDLFDETIYLAVMQLVLEARKKQFRDVDQRLFDHILKHSSLTMLPTEFDPRKKEG